MITRLATSDRSDAAAGVSYAAHRDRLLGTTLLPALLAVAAISLFQASVDLTRHHGSLSSRIPLYALAIGIPLIAAALSRLPILAGAGRWIAAATDFGYTLVIVGFLVDPVSTLSGTDLNLCLKLLTTAILFPWPPAQQRVSSAMTVVIYWCAITYFGRSIEHTHQMTTPILAGILAALGSAHIDRARRALFQHALDLEGSERQLRTALETERHLVSLARQTAVLDDLPTVLSQLSRGVVEGLRCDFATIYLLDEGEADVLRFASSYPAVTLPANMPALAIHNWSATAMKKDLERHEALLLDDIEEKGLMARKMIEKCGARRLAVTPITVSGQMLGVLTAGRTTDSPEFEERHISLLRAIAAHAALAIHNAKLFQKLTSSETAYRDLFERANDLIFIADDEGRVHFANKAALDFFHVSPEDLGRIDWTDLLEPTERSRMERRIVLQRRVGATQPNDGGTIGGFEVTARTPQGTTVSLELRTCRIGPPESVPRRFHCIARDVTERNRRHEETETLLQRLQESHRLQDEFVANMSHELRTPLNVIIGYADLIADERSLAISSDARSFLDRIGAASRALHRMVESILEYARLDRGRMVIIPTHFSSDHLLLELLGLCNDVRTSFEVELAIHQEEPIEFATDYDRLYSVLSNLLLNALKFTPRGRVFLHLQRDGEEAEFIIRDTGIGIHPRELRHVFEPFRQADGSDTRTFGGVGLGLAIVRRNVDLLHGNIDVESEVEVGTTFVLRIPVRLDGRSIQGSETRGAA